MVRKGNEGSFPHPSRSEKCNKKERKERKKERNRQGMKFPTRSRVTWQEVTSLCFYTLAQNKFFVKI